MCGLAGIVNINQLNNKDFLERKLNKSYHYLKARGPDEKGMWHDKNSFFLHTRLKIIDLQNSSSQPMEYGNYVLSYNGEIYNFNRLKDLLRQENKGWRLDYFIINKYKITDVLQCNIKTDIYGSDHCPLELFIKKI